MRRDQFQVYSLSQLEHILVLTVLEFVCIGQVLLDFCHGHFEKVSSRLVLLGTLTHVQHELLNAGSEYARREHI